MSWIVVEYEGAGSIPQTYFGYFTSIEMATDFAAKNTSEREVVDLVKPSVADWRQQ